MCKAFLSILCFISYFLSFSQKFRAEYVGFNSFISYEDQKPPKRLFNFTLLLDGTQSYGYGEVIADKNDTSVIKSTDSKASEIYKISSQNELLFKSKIIGAKKSSYFSDSLHNFSWVITNLQKKIDTLTVYKAMCIWRGRAYTAWFAPTIPFSNGPEKFGGLPGLIIEIYSDGNEYYRRLKTFSKAEFSILEPPVAEGNYEFMVKKAKEYYARFVEQVTALDKVNPNCKDCKQSTEIVAIDLEFTYVL